MKNIMNNNRMFNEIMESMTPKNINTYNNFIAAIGSYKTEFKTASFQQLLEEIKGLSFHAGWSDFPAQIQELNTEKTYVRSEESEYMLSIYAYIPNNECDDYYLGVYDLWKPCSKREYFKPMQGAEVFCRAYAALQIIQEMYPELLKSGYVEL